MAILPGNKAKAIAEQVLSELDDAEGWGTRDLLGGGLISDLAKHSSLDDAQEEIKHRRYSFVDSRPSLPM